MDFNQKEFFKQIKDVALTQEQKDKYWKMLDEDFLATFRDVMKYSPVLTKNAPYKRTFKERPFTDDKYNAYYVKTKIEHAATGPLLGKKVAVKDNITIADVPMQIGTKLLDGYQPKEDATVIKRLLNAGAEINGKAVSENLFVAGSSFSADTGLVQNPLLPGYSAGGSSSGSAALVAGNEVDFALGCDQTGSIRIPASWCGIYGFKPSRGVVPYTGIASVDQLLDYVGPMSKTMDNIILAMDVLAGPDGLDSRQKEMKQTFHFAADMNTDLRGKKIALVKEGFGLRRSEKVVDETVRENILAFEKLGAEVQEISLPDFEMGRTVVDTLNSLATYRQLIKTGGASLGSENYYPVDLSEALNEQLVPENYAQLPPIVQVILYSGMLADHSATDYYGRAQNLLLSLKQSFAQVMQKFDILALPSTPFTATKLPDLEGSLEELVTGSMGMDANLGVFNALGYPAISIPCKFSDYHKPIGMQLVGAFGADQTVLNFAQAYEDM
ncbi:aspartyl/glutamyl-tRNA(Asn/Gln) amidotransferase subunit A [Ligilactobacillus salitolerans]|uniref:Aspartyl/glutamyl-tRNA(Asn/Gln) amidotransferase subunit A n=1 Tax=Ligilactobacillus salitolerans TaxID=1808352 RepID=A0A401IVS6_9LACO|nr:amidase family protein [Ligilactobacillus salitolerans]GBG95606.1 aspartyl/glutamyl-tRNA(Asn/Gln) amidotransferase subunit A [Ligilactobacillus salitolerans]